MCLYVCLTTDAYNLAPSRNRNSNFRMRLQSEIHITKDYTLKPNRDFNTLATTIIRQRQLHSQRGLISKFSPTK